VADEASEGFDAMLAKKAKQAHKVVDFGDKASSVKATLALRELGSLLQRTTATLTEWIPASSSEEKKQGYTKFHLGAALIQQGFPQYITMQGMQQALQQIQDDILPNRPVRQLSDVFRNYHTQVDRFCVCPHTLPAFLHPSSCLTSCKLYSTTQHVMADLGMYKIMKKCLKFAVAPEVEESSDEEAMNITIEGETMDGKEHSMDMEVEPSIAGRVSDPTRYSLRSVKSVTDDRCHALCLAFRTSCTTVR
jgi:hypothetical protein